ncbi:MAG: hypothetical protein ACODAJ_04930 [Planctomycetota bacterium]
MADQSDTVERILALEAEMARIQELKQAATGDMEVQELDAQRRSLDFKHQDLLKGLTREEQEALEQARAGTEPGEPRMGTP